MDILTAIRNATGPRPGNYIDYYCFTRLPGGRRYLLVTLIIENKKQCSLPVDTFQAIVLIEKGFLVNP